MATTDMLAPVGGTDRRPVEVVRWPEEADRRLSLAEEAIPRLLVVAAMAPPPVCWDDLEDWVREPLDAAELHARADQLRRRASGPVARPPTPILDADGVVRVGGAWASIPPVEARLLAQLLHRSGHVVARRVLLEAGWPSGTPDERILHGRIRMLRRRLAPLGVRIETVRGVGFLLEVA